MLGAGLTPTTKRERERVMVEATVEERSRYAIINQSSRLDRMVLIWSSRYA
jgi:hypothetical protein